MPRPGMVRSVISWEYEPSYRETERVPVSCVTGRELTPGLAGVLQLHPPLTVGVLAGGVWTVSRNGGRFGPFWVEPGDVGRLVIGIRVVSLGGVDGMFSASE